MSNEEKARSRQLSEARFVERIDAAGPEALARFEVPMFGSTADAVRLLTMSLSEHAVHTWDVAVMADPAAPLAAESTPFILDGLGLMVGWVGKPQGTPGDATVVTSDPERVFRLTIGEGVQLVPQADATGDGAPSASLRLPAESLIRLVYGRLDPEHTPATVEASGVELDGLRAVFPGF